MPDPAPIEPHPSPQGAADPRSTWVTGGLPIPPEDMRALVGIVDPSYFDNPTGANVLPEVGERAYGSVFDFGCGCGRLARQLIQQDPQPKRYVGIDLHAGMVRWCDANLAPHAPQFDFVHHDVRNIGLNPESLSPHLAFPVEDDAFDVVVAHSVFTHVLEADAIHYLRECSRVLDEDGMLLSTWFLFDKAFFPMMQAFQNALYINDVDPTNAVVFDRAWLRAAAADAGLVVAGAARPEVRGFHWTIVLAPATSGHAEVPFPEDDAPLGSVPPPVLSVPAYSVGGS